MKQDRLKSRWQKACTRWCSRLFLNGWHLDIGVSNRARRLRATGTDNRNAGASTELTPAYREAAITLYRDVFSEDTLNEYACHEVSHLLIGKLQILAKEAIFELPKPVRDGWLRRLSETTEETTTSLQNVFLWSVKDWKDD